MIEQKELNKIKEAVHEFFDKMTITVSDIEVTASSEKNSIEEAVSVVGEKREIVDVKITLDEPQILIGQGGQTLFEIQRLVRTILNKKLKEIFYLNLDINDYKKKKLEYLKDIAKDLADQVALRKEEKVLLPMSSYERRIIHAELADRTDVVTESQGDGSDRHIVIKAK